MIMDPDANSETPEAPGTPGGPAPAPSRQPSRRNVIAGAAAVAGAGGLTVAATSAGTAQAAPATAVADWGACLTSPGPSSYGTTRTSRSSRATPTSS